MSMAKKYAKERKEDLLPRSMKALSVGMVENWAHWIADPVKQQAFIKDGKFLLVVDRARMIDEDARKAFCADCVEWFLQHELSVEATHSYFDQKSERYSEIYFQVKDPDPTKAKKLVDTLKNLGEELAEQIKIDEFYVRRST